MGRYKTYQTIFLPGRELFSGYPVCWRHDFIHLKAGFSAHTDPYWNGTKDVVMPIRIAHSKQLYLRVYRNDLILCIGV